MKRYTIADVAKVTGVGKQTVRRRAKEIGLYDRMQVIDARGTMSMTSEQAAVLADAVMKSSPEGIAEVAARAKQDDLMIMHDAVVDALRETIRAKDELIDALRTRIDTLEEEAERLRSERCR
jgi:polyhydroxyalkanoate synthesis regulator phasin